MLLQRARVRSIDLREDLVHIHRRERELQAARHVERAHALHGLRHVVDGALDDGELLARAIAEAAARASSIDCVYSAAGDSALLMSCAMPLAICPSARSRSCCITVCCVWRRSW